MFCSLGRTPGEGLGNTNESKRMKVFWFKKRSLQKKKPSCGFCVVNIFFVVRGSLHFPTEEGREAGSAGTRSMSKQRRYREKTSDLISVLPPQNFALAPIGRLLAAGHAATRAVCGSVGLIPTWV